MSVKIHKTSTKLTLLLITFILPVLISWILFYYHEHFHFKTTNHGTLISPPIQAANLFTNTTDQRAWQIMYVPTTCTENACAKTMFTLSQLRKALGKDSNRVELVMMTPAPLKLKETYHFQMIALTSLRYAQLEAELRKKVVLDSTHISFANKIYLVDPDGNIMMYYSSTGNAMDILKDLKHLLGVSQIG